MKRAVVCCLAVLAAGALRPAVAGNIYIPIVERSGVSGATHDSEVWISNGGQAQRSFVTTFLSGNSDGTKRNGVVSSARIRVGVNGTFRLGNTAPASQHGLLEVDAAPQLLVGARLASALPGAAPSFAALPVISSDNMLAAGETAQLLGLERQTSRITDLSVINLGKTAAQCDITLFRSSGAQITAASVAVPPLSLRRFGDALSAENGITDARASVKCNRAFFAFATQTDLATARVAFAAPSAAGTSTLTSPSGGTTTPPPPPPTPATGSVVFEIPGLVLEPSRQQEVREGVIPLSRDLSLKQLIVDLDFTIGPWNPRENDGPHAIIWLYRGGAYRSSTIANVNLHGPNKNKIRMNQNLDLPGLSDTLAQQNGHYESGSTYHFNYVYNAEANRIRVRVTKGSEVINDFTFAGSAARRTISLSTKGLNYVFGHRSGLHYEVTSYGWRYSNFRVTMVPY